MKIIVNDRIHLTPLAAEDRAACVPYLNDRQIYEQTLRIPFPYTEADFDNWLAIVAKMNAEQGKSLHWAIRDEKDQLIGGIGFNSREPGSPHRSEIGYWLARPFWGQGIMTQVVGRCCQYGFAEFGLVKITAHVFSFNRASARVLEKCGFVEEGFLRKHFVKDGSFIDARAFALIP